MASVPATSAVNGATYVGYLDNVSLVTVPEPSTFALVAIGGTLILGFVLEDEA
ncbi:MAG TPA: PEP-CTERM sorting domain-containing protein [Candidatus Binatia bacterium]|nr:PEP-CTERM sorting domain-containing protein [Candidatus Binatia bacterium]